jgi:hypothetical protein
VKLLIVTGRCAVLESDSASAIGAANPPPEILALEFAETPFRDALVDSLEEPDHMRNLPAAVGSALASLIHQSVTE